MPRESYSATVSRHLEVLNECFSIITFATDQKEREQVMKMFYASAGEIERVTRLRIDASAYEAERRAGKELVELGRVIRPRRG